MGTDPNGQPEGAALVDQVEKHEAPTIGSGIELEIHGSDPVGMHGPMASH
jgi:hypothetical protein